jgi:hypothetical protein
MSRVPTVSYRSSCGGRPLQHGSPQTGHDQLEWVRSLIQEVARRGDGRDVSEIDLPAALSCALDRWLAPRLS